LPSWLNGALALANALLSAATVVFLICGWRAIRRKQRDRHRNWMLAAFAASTLFLISFVARFAAFGFAEYRGTGAWKGVYTAVFFSHEPLAVINVPLAIVSVVLGLRGNLAAHREVSRRTLPVWLYVAITGVVLYLMLYVAPGPAR
jgi:putative membrane protein